ncbi:MAG: hypothetical protein AAFQ45_02095 [Pseudomonadota bacterium]
MTDNISLKTSFVKANGRSDSSRSKEALLAMARLLARRAAEADYAALLEEERKRQDEPGGSSTPKKGDPKP